MITRNEILRHFRQKSEFGMKQQFFSQNFYLGLEATKSLSNSISRKIAEEMNKNTHKQNQLVCFVLKFSELFGFHSRNLERRVVPKLNG